MANTFTWNTTNGDWSIGSNWTDITSATAGPPTSADDAEFVSNGGTITGTGAAFDVFFSGINPWTLGGNFTIADDVLVGNNAPATVIIASGGTIASAGTFNAVGNNAGSDGSLQITSGGTFDSTLAPQSASFVLSIGDSGASGTLAAATGIVTVSGTKALLNLNGNALALGLDGGNGSLVISNSGSVSVGTPDSAAIAALSVGDTGTGTVTVDGSGSHLTVGGFAAFGGGGYGELQVQNSGTATFGAAPANGGGLVIGLGSGSAGAPTGGNGAANIIGGLLDASATGIIVGGDGVDGTMKVNGGGTVLAGSFFSVGTAVNVSGSVVGGTGVVDIGPNGAVKITEAAQTSSYAVEIGSANSNVGGPTTASNGVVNVSGAQALLNTNGNGMEVGRLGNGSLTISQGGSVIAGTPDSTQIESVLLGGQGGNGSIIITDTGSNLTSNGFMGVGRAGTGNLVVENSGTLVVGLDPQGNGDLTIGAGSPATDAVIFTGGSGSALITSNGTATSQQDIVVGNDGVDGQLTVDNGGTVDAAARLFIGETSDTIAAGTTIITLAGTTVTTAPTTLSSDGIVNVGAGGLLEANGSGIIAAGTSDIVVGAGVDSTGALNVSGAGALVNSGGFRIAIGAFGQGEVTVSQGGSLEAASAFSGDDALGIGEAAGGTGSLEVTDSGSSVTALGQLSVGDAGSGVLIIQNAATVTTGNNGSVDPSQGVDIAEATGGSGQATVSGTDSLLTNTGRFVVGDLGAGSLDIQSGGTVITTPGTVAGLAGADIAAQAGSDGSSVTVTGVSSTWSIGGTLIVGDLAAGALDVSAGGSVSATALVLGNSAGGVGNLALSGTGSNVTLATGLTVGGSGIADISIANGATLAGTDGDIGLSAGSSGVIDIEGANSRLDLSDNLNIGDAGTGVLIMGANTTLSVENNLNIGAAGALDQFGGVIDPATGTIQAGGSLGGTGGTDTFSNFLLNDGVFFATSGLPETLNAGSITGTGSLVVNNGGTLAINAGSVVATQTVEFTNAGTPAVLQIGTLGGFGAALGNFNGLDSVVVQGVSIGSDGYTPGSGGADGVLTLFSAVGQGGSVLGTLNVAAGFPVGDVAALEVVTNGTIGGVPCFAAGTRIVTERGLVAVEALAVGDRVRLAPDGPDAEAWLPVVWIGRRVVDCRHHPKPRAVWPVRVRAGAFGAGCPGREVYLSPDHAVYAEGVLIPVKYLIDGESVAQVAVDQVAYFHVELERHAVLLAEGLAAESYLDTGDRSSFINGGGAVRLHADFASLRWEAQGCAPLVVTGTEVERVRARVKRAA